ncbi:MAG: glycosyltransferase family 9 protein [Planctomycetota bacterium]
MNILVFRVGQLGDTLAALPAFWAVRSHFKHDSLTLLSDVQAGKPYVVAQDLLQGSGLFDAFMTYVYHPSPVMRGWYLARLWAQLHARKFDTLVYLYPSGRSAEATVRDRRFFQFVGIHRFIGMESNFTAPPKKASQPLPVLPFESDLTLARLAGSEIPIPMSGKGRFDLNLGGAEERAVAGWLSSLPQDGGRRWIGVGPGSKMKAKIWPVERFRDAVARLIEAHDLWPVVFGSQEDEGVGDDLIRAWQRGYNAAGHLSLRASAAALGRCRLYFGNDTGTMHLAASAKTPCAAIFSARDYPGRWEPCGVPRRVLRSAIECEGCMLTDCVERRMECLMRISVDDAVAACESLLRECAVMS